MCFFLCGSEGKNVFRFEDKIRNSDSVIQCFKIQDFPEKSFPLGFTL